MTSNHCRSDTIAIIAHFHERNLHTGPQALLGIIRSHDEGSKQMYKMLSNEASSSGAYNGGSSKGTT